MTQPLPPGWYPDPNDPSRNHFWDGTAWNAYGPPLEYPTSPTPPSAAADKTETTFGRKTLLVYAAAAVGVIALFAVALNLTSWKQGSSGASEDSIRSKVISACQNSIKEKLRDPDSARFGDDWTAEPTALQDSTRSLFTDFHPEKGDKLYAAKGSVNAKNAFGGYVGDRVVGCDAYYTSTDGHAHAHAYEIG